MQSAFSAFQSHVQGSSISFFFSVKFDCRGVIGREGKYSEDPPSSTIWCTCEAIVVTTTTGRRRATMAGVSVTCWSTSRNPRTTETLTLLPTVSNAFGFKISGSRLQIFIPFRTRTTSQNLRSPCQGKVLFLSFLSWPFFDLADPEAVVH